MTTSILRFVNILLTALLAGVSLGIWIGFDPSALSQSAYLEQQQNMVGSLKVLMISLVIAATFVTLINAFVHRHIKSTFIALLSAAIFLVACIVITKFGNLPIDDQVMAWTPSTMPDNWKELRDKWSFLHTYRSLVELAALSLVTWAGVRNK